MLKLKENVDTQCIAKRHYKNRIQDRYLSHKTKLNTVINPAGNHCATLCNLLCSRSFSNSRSSNPTWHKTNTKVWRCFRHSWMSLTSFCGFFARQVILHENLNTSLLLLHEIPLSLFFHEHVCDGNRQCGKWKFLLSTRHWTQWRKTVKKIL